MSLRETALPDNALLDGSLFEKYGPCRLVIESAHLQPRGRSSVAQVFPLEELKQLAAQADDKGVRVYAFPQKQTRRAREAGGYISEVPARETELERRARLTREKFFDPMAICEFLQDPANYGFAYALKRFKVPTAADEERKAAMNDIRIDTNLRLNEMRRFSYATDHPDVAHATRIVKAIVKADQERAEEDRILSTATCEYFGVRLDPKTGDFYKTKFKPAQLMSLYVSVFNDEQQIRLNPNGQFIGMKFIWAQLLISPYHGKSGTAHSNLLYHGLKNFDKTDFGYELTEAEWARRAAYRREWRVILKQMIRAFRDVGLAEKEARDGQAASG